MRGLAGRRDLAPDEALLIPGATSVHTFGMRFTILVVRLEASLVVVDVRQVPPRRILPPMQRSRHVLECHPAVDLRVGDRLWIGSPTGATAGAGAP